MPKIKHKNYLLFTLIVIILILTFIFIYPQVEKIKENANKISAEKIKLENNLETKKKIKQVQDSQDYYSNLKNSLAESLIYKDNTLELIIPLENIAGDLNLKQNIEILETKEKNNNSKDDKDILEDLSGQNVRLRLEGDYKNILNYFVKLKELGLMYDINSIQLRQKGYIEEFNKKQEEVDAGITEAILEIKFFTK